MVDPFTVMAGISTATQIYGGIRQMKSNVQQARQQARFEEQQLSEYLMRREKNFSLLNRDIREFNQTTIGDAASRNIDVGSSAVLQQLADNSVRAANAIDSYMRETQFNANQARYGINALRRSADEMEDAGILNALTSSISGAYSIYRTAPGTKKQTQGSSFISERREGGSSSLSATDSFSQNATQNSSLLGE